MAEIREVVAHDHEFPFNFDVTFSERAVVPGYTQWSETYDAPATNPALIIEEAIVHPILARLPPGRALDVACGTGRHACHPASLGHHVIGVDATPAMLELARAKAPQIDFREGQFETLPVDDGSIDVLTCALALCHERSVASAIVGVRPRAASGRHGRRVRHASDVHEHRRRRGVSVEGHHERSLRAQPRTPRRRMVRRRSAPPD